VYPVNYTYYTWGVQKGRSDMEVHHTVATYNKPLRSKANKGAKFYELIDVFLKIQVI